MKRLLALMLLCTALCSSCTAFPAEERAFAVALGVSGGPGAWTVYARIPTYQSGGGYATMTGEGDTLPHALSALDAASPMALHLGQLRLIVFHADTARDDAFPAALRTLAERPDMRGDAALAAAQPDMAALMDALTPPTGTRLSKSLDVLLEARINQGTVLSSTLADVMRMGERQQSALMNASLEGESFTLSGCWPVGDDGRVSEMLPPEETQLLALMLGRLKQGTLSLAEGTISLISAAVEAELELPVTQQQAALRITLRVQSTPLAEEALSRALATACLGLLNRLSAMGCDALGLARQAVTHVTDMEQWHALNWPERYRDLDWSVSVGVEGAL